MNFLNKLLGPKQKKDGKFYSMCRGGCKEQCQECKDLEKSVTIKYKEMKIQSDVFISKFFEVLEKSNFSPQLQQRIKDCFNGPIPHEEASKFYRAAFTICINNLKPLEDECEKLKHRVIYLEGIYGEKVLEKASLGNEIVRLEKLVNEKNGKLNQSFPHSETQEFIRAANKKFDRKLGGWKCDQEQKAATPASGVFHGKLPLTQQEIMQQKQTNNMEKTITMSLETALEFYKTTQDKILKDWLICNFGRDALEKKEGFTWEESFAGDGYFISDNSYIVEARIRYENSFSKQFFKTKNQALSALAFAQLSHIVNKYNEGKTVPVTFRDGIPHTFHPYMDCDGMLTYHALNHTCNKYRPPFGFYDKNDIEISFKVNKELWNQYFQK